MNIFNEIKALFALKSASENIYKEAVIMNGTKPGWKTTEFWGKVGVQVMTLWGAVSGFVPPKWAIVISTGLEATYAICRTTAKAVSDVQAAKMASLASAPV